MKSWSTNGMGRFALDVIVCVVIVLVVTTGLSQLLTWLGVSTAVPSLLKVVAIITMQNAAILGYVYWRMQHHDSRTTRIGWRSRTSWVGTCLWSVPAVFMANLVVAGGFALFGVRHNQAASYPLSAGDTLGQLVFALVAVIVAPLCEEILFRGYLLGRLRSMMPTWIAVVASALLFALAHSFAAKSGAIVLVVGTFVMGMILGWARVVSRSLWPAVVAHMVNNGVAITAVTYCINHPGRGCALSP
jgi:membrane protease YdiL (CAAX protease family)